MAARSVWRVMGAAGLAAWLSACSLGTATSEPPKAALAPQPVLETPAPADQSQQAALPAAPIPSPAPAPSPEELVGLGSREVAELLGFPQLRRRENPAELWQYANQSCILDLFFSRDSEPARVAYVNLRSLNPVKISRGQCMSELMPKGGKG